MTQLCSLGEGNDDRTPKIHATDRNRIPSGDRSRRGSAAGDRTRQARALLTFADQRKAAAKTDQVLLVGDCKSSG